MGVISLDRYFPGEHNDVHFWRRASIESMKTPGSSLEHGIFMGPLSLHQLTLGTHGGMFFP